MFQPLWNQSCTIVLPDTLHKQFASPVQVGNCRLHQNPSLWTSDGHPKRALVVSPTRSALPMGFVRLSTQALHSWSSPHALWSESPCTRAAPLLQKTELHESLHNQQTVYLHSVKLGIWIVILDISHGDCAMGRWQLSGSIMRWHPVHFIDTVESCELNIFDNVIGILQIGKVGDRREVSNMKQIPANLSQFWT